MRISRPISKPAPKTKAPRSEQLDDKRSASEWADVIKQRSTLANLVEPAGVVVGYLQNPLLNLGTVADGAGALIKGNFSEAGEALETLVDRGYNPKGVGGAIYNSAQVIQTLSGFAVGGLEVYAGLQSDDKHLAMMGVADLAGAAGNASLLLGFDTTAVSLSMASSVARAALILKNPEKFSRTQKVKTVLDSSGAVASSMLKSGVLILPALGVSAVAGLGQVAYMNHGGFRERVDGLIDKVIGSKRPQDSSATIVDSTGSTVHARKTSS